MREACRSIGIQKPCEETLAKIKEVIEKEGENAVTLTELKAIMERVFKELNLRR